MAQQNQQIQQQKTTIDKQVAILSSKTTQWITDNLRNPNMAVAVPKGYNIGNEVSSLIFAISRVKDKDGRSVLEVCDPEQVMNQVRDCALQGLSVTRKHVWPIIYGGELTLQMSYFGLVASLSYMFPDLQVYANVLYEGDEYDYCTDDIRGYNYVTNIRSSIANRDKPIIAGYGNIVDKKTNKRVYGLVMTMSEIRQNWAKSRNKDNNVQKEFPQEMAKRTVISRMVKMFVYTANSSTNTEQIGAFRRMTEGEYIDIDPDRTDETDKQRMLRSKSEGSKGLKSMLDAEKKAATGVRETSVSEAVTSEGEIIQETHENAPATQEEASPSKVGRAPSVRVDEWGNVVPNDAPSEAADEYGDNLPF